MDAEAIREVFRGFGPVQIRLMFGGKGIYQGELMASCISRRMRKASKSSRG
jgi:DNA transformation protein